MTATEMELIYHTGWGPGAAYTTFGCDLNGPAQPSSVRSLDHPVLNEVIGSFADGVGVPEGVPHAGVWEQAPLVIHARQVISKPTRDGWRRSGYEVIAVVDVPEGLLSAVDLDTTQQKLLAFLEDIYTARIAEPGKFSEAAPFLQRLDGLANELRAALPIVAVQHWSESEPKEESVKPEFWTRERLLAGAVAVLLMVGSFGIFSLLRPGGDVMQMPDAPIQQQAGEDPEREPSTRPQPEQAEGSTDDLALIGHWNEQCPEAKVVESDARAWLEQPGVRTVLTRSRLGASFDPFEEEWPEAGSEWRKLLSGEPPDLEIICRQKQAIRELRTALQALAAQASQANDELEGDLRRPVRELTDLYLGILQNQPEAASSPMLPVFGSADRRLLMQHVPAVLCALVRWKTPDSQCEEQNPVIDPQIELLISIIDMLKRHENIFLRLSLSTANSYSSLVEKLHLLR